MSRVGQRLPSAFSITLVMLAMVILPVGVTLHTIHASTLKADYDASGSPYGYTVSLLIFLVPSAFILFWLIPQQGLNISKRALAWSVGLLFPVGAALDFFFARYFFVYPNAGATLRIKAPALGGGVPVEEYLFYFMGFLAVLLLYTWLDEYWLAAYSATAEQRVGFDRLLGFHPWSLALAAGLIATGILFQRHVARVPGGFPGYFVFLVLGAGLPSSVLLPAARPVINWRALSLTMFTMLVTSLLWEVTLALPYGWWNFNDQEMLGVRITAWAQLPIEEVYVWVSVTYATVIVYEIVKRWKASERGMREALLGGRKAA